MRPAAKVYSGAAKDEISIYIGIVKGNLYKNHSFLVKFPIFFFHLWLPKAHEGTIRKMLINYRSGSY
jgi:hypothetical protein